MSEADGTHFLDDNGHEVVDSTPLSPPIGWQKQPSMVDIIRDMVRSERLKQEAEEAGFESFEEADDFDVGEDRDQLPHTPYEAVFDPPPPPSEQPPKAEPSGDQSPPAAATNAPDPSSTPPAQPST